MKALLILFALLLLCFGAKTACAEVTVVFDTNGGTTEYAPLRLAPNENDVVYFHLPDEAPVRPGYSFIGWYCQGLEMAYGLCKPGESIAFSAGGGTITYVAQWQNNDHQASCPYLMAWTCDDNDQADIIQVEFQCIEEAPATYYAVHNWFGAAGYAGFQIFADGTHALIMSIWDLDGLRPTIEYYAPNVIEASPFDGEGTGMHVLTKYDWTKLRWYTMRIQARTVGNKTCYEQWIRPEGGEWEKICVISLPKAGLGFQGDVAFLEDFSRVSNVRRAMQLRNSSCRLAATGVWKKNLRFTISNYEDNYLKTYCVNYNCKAEPASDNALYLHSGGGGYEPVIELPKDVQLNQGEIVDPFLLE